jgi:hypothetical protein
LTIFQDQGKKNVRFSNHAESEEEDGDDRNPDDESNDGDRNADDESNDDGDDDDDEAHGGEAYSQDPARFFISPSYPTYFDSSKYSPTKRARSNSADNEDDEAEDDDERAIKKFKDDCSGARLGKPKISDYPPPTQAVLVGSQRHFRYKMTWIDPFPNVYPEAKWVRTAWGDASKECEISVPFTAHHLKIGSCSFFLSTHILTPS